MDFTGRKILKKLIAVLIIFAMTMSDFILVGSSVVTYAVDMSKTNNSNVMISAYFMNENGEKVGSVEQDITSDRQKMYVDIAVQNEGYFDGQIILGESNFKIKDVSKKGAVSKFENGTVYLNRLNAGTTETIELDVEPSFETSLKEADLNKKSEVKITGKYTNSKRTEDISGKTETQILYKTSKTAEVESNLEVLTNKVYNLDSNNKRVVQLLITSKLANNSYPVKNTNIELSLPQGVENVTAFARTTNATNGDKEEFNEKNYTYNKEQNKLTMTIENKEDSQGKIAFNKNAEDKIVVTLVYPEAANLANSKFTANTKIITFDNAQKTKSNEVTVTGELDGAVNFELESSEKEMYKGKLYSGENREYTSYTNVNVNLANVTEKITINENEANYDEKNNASIYFKQTRVNAEEFKKYLGENGEIKLYDATGNQISILNSKSKQDDNGNYFVDFAENVEAIKYEISTPVQNGVLSIQNTKKIVEKSYNRNQIEGFTKISEEVTGTATAKNEITLKETETKADFSITNTSFSTSEETSTRMTVVLENSDESKDLYKNPTLKFTFPKQVTGIRTSYKLIHGNGLTIDKENSGLNDKTLTIKLSGEQTQYAKDVTEGTTIVIDVTLKQDITAVSSKEEIKFNYTNENARKYADNGEAKVDVNIVAKNPVIVTNKINEEKVEAIGDESKEISLEIDKASKDYTNMMSITNNEISKISDVRVLGKFPTNGTANNLGIKLNMLIGLVEDKNVTIYYSEKENPTNDISNNENGWKKDINLASARSYLMIIDSMEVGETLNFGYKMTIPANLTYNLDAKAGYEVSYKNGTLNKTNTVKAGTIDFNTGKSAVLEQTVMAKVGNTEIKSGDTVNVGEIIKYTVTVKNVGNEDATGINVTATVPNGTTFIKYAEVKENNEQVPDKMPEMFEMDENKKEVTYSNNTIKAKSELTFEYMVKVTGNVKEVENKVKTTYSNGKNFETSIKNNIQSSDFELTMLKNETIYNDKIKSGYSYRYELNVKNTSSNTKKDVKLTINTNELQTLNKVTYVRGDNVFEFTTRDINISQINAGEEIKLVINVTVNQANTKNNSTELYAQISDNNRVYKSNVINEELESVNLEVGISSNSTSEAEGYLHKGDKVSYTINVKNIGKVDANNLEIVDRISDNLEIDSVTLNGKNTEYDVEENDNYSEIKINSPLKVNESAEVVINAHVDEDLILKDIVKVTNSAILYNNVEVAKTEEITYLLENKITSEDIQDGSAVISEDDEEANKKLDKEIEGKENGEKESSSEGTSKETSNTTTGEKQGDESNNSTGNKEQGSNSEGKDSSNSVNKFTIAGTAWKDENENGVRDPNEPLLGDITVKVIDVQNKGFVKDSDGKDLSTKTNSEGLYTISNLPNGKYIVVFEYDTAKYMLTTYKAEGVQNDKNSDAIMNNITLNGETKSMATTDIIELSNSIANIDIGLLDAKVFDLELNKYISKIVVTSNEGTKTYEYKDSELAKVEIGAKYLNNAQVVIEYTIRVKNAGEIAGYVRNIVDYKSSELSFSSTLNSDWYSQGENLYNSSLANTKIEPGETKEVKLILTKTMTESNTGLIGNTAEIVDAYNTRGIQDKDSTPGNKVNKEDDMGQADVIIGVKTGAVISYILLTLSIIAVIGVGAFMVAKKVLSKEIEI